MSSDFKKVLGKELCKGLFALFIIPAVSLGFIFYGQARIDSDIERLLIEQIEGEPNLAPEQVAARKKFVHEIPVSAACASADPGLASYRAAFCDRLSPAWQFYHAKRLSWLAVALAIAAIVATATLGAAAFYNRALQYTSFMFGWRFLTAVGAVEIIAQGVLAVWLSFWVTALLFNRYLPKLIFCIGAVVAMSAWIAIRGLFSKPKEHFEIEGEIISEEDAPGLWRRIRELAQQVGTSPPTQLVGGIDANFFVSEMPCIVQGKTLHGRLLYISLPLVRQLDAAESEAILGHELGHFEGGDTQHSAAIGPQLIRFDSYLQALRAGKLNAISLGLLSFYRLIFELALRKESREREFAADRAAVAVTSAEVFGRALAKTIAYSSYRNSTERSLFERDTRLEGDLTLAQVVANGFVAHADSPAFIEEIKEGRQAHPFDSHPPLSDRIAAAGLSTSFEADIPALIKTAPRAHWASEIRTAEGIETKLWGAYEEQFKQQHEQMLAYRYAPATSEEQAHVEKFFPACEFLTKKGTAFKLTFSGLTPPGSAEQISFEQIRKVEVVKSFGTEILRIVSSPQANKRGTTTKLPLNQFGKGAAELLETIGRYHHRHQVMTALREEHEAAARHRLDTEVGASVVQS